MLKRFIKYYKPYLPLFILDMAAAIVVAACNMYYPTVAKEIINTYIHLDTPNMLLIASGILLLVYLLKALCNYIVSYYGHLVGIYMQADMRRDLFRKYESLPYSYYDSHKTGDLLSRLVNDLFDVSELAHHGPENLFLSVLMFIGSFCMLASINLQLTLIVFAAVPFVLLFAILSRRSMTRAMSASRKQIGKVNVRVENSISGIRETKAYVAGHVEQERFDNANRIFVGHRKDAHRALGRFETVMQFSTDFLYLLIILVGGLFLFHGRIDAGEFTAFILYINMFLTPIQRFVTLFQQFQEGMTGFARFHEVMEEGAEIDTGTEVIEDIRGDITFDNVTFSYDSESGEKPVIKNLNLEIRAGETVALVGPSGGGKTTMCNLIPRFYNISSGRILIDGRDTREITLESLRSHIGTVSQSVFLFDGSVRENIAYGSDGASNEEIEKAARRANIHDFIMTLENGYDTEVGERGVKLSGGQRQRIAIARMFMKNPRLLILDEATSALDNATEMQVQSALTELSRDRTVIVVAHRLSTVKGADKIVVLDNTGILEMGTHEELLSKGGEYKKLYSYQFKE